jgi:hypothetical protein
VRRSAVATGARSELGASPGRRRVAVHEGAQRASGLENARRNFDIDALWRALAA